MSNPCIPNPLHLTAASRCVGVSDQLQLFAKEQERKKLLYSSAPRTSDSAPVTPKTPSTSKKAAKKTPAAKKTQKAGRGGSKGAEEAVQTCDDGDVDPADEGLDGDKGKGRRSGAKRNKAGRKSRSKQTQPETPIVQPTPDECEHSLILCSYNLKMTLLEPNSHPVLCLTNFMWSTFLSFFFFCRHSGETPACSNDTTPDSESESKAGNFLPWLIYLSFIKLCPWKQPKEHD